MDYEAADVADEHDVEKSVQKRKFQREASSAEPKTGLAGLGIMLDKCELAAAQTTLPGTYMSGLLLSLLKNILMPVHVRTTSLSSWGVRHRYLAVALSAQSYCHVAYADPSAIHLQTIPQAIANKNLRRNRLPKSTSGPFPSATPPTYHFYKRP